MNNLKAKVGSDPCGHCGSKGCAVYARGDVRFGCAKCVGEFLEQLPPAWRPWRMTFWDDVKQLFGGVR